MIERWGLATGFQATWVSSSCGDCHVNYKNTAHFPAVVTIPLVMFPINNNTVVKYRNFNSLSRSSLKHVIPQFAMFVLLTSASPGGHLRPASQSINSGQYPTLSSPLLLISCREQVNFVSIKSDQLPCYGTPNVPSRPTGR